MSSLKAPRYGAITVADDEPTDHSFDADQAYYLKETSAYATPQQRLRKRLLGSIPLLAALLIMGGSAYYLYRSFDRLYPGPGGGGGTPSTVDRSRSAPSPTRPSSTKSVHHVDAAQCDAHPACAPLGGDCCPTADGVMLECCLA
jgi:hypothetical protein